MNLAEADATLRAAFAPFQHVQLTDDLRESWYEVALRDCDYLNGMRIARALAATCDFPPVPKQFLEMHRAAMLPERKVESLSEREFVASDSGRVWARHCSVMSRTIGRHNGASAAIDLERHEPITGESWAVCGACRAYARELAMKHESTGTDDQF